MRFSEMGGEVRPTSSALDDRPTATVMMDVPERLIRFASGSVSKGLMFDSPSVTITTRLGTSVWKKEVREVERERGRER